MNRSILLLVTLVSVGVCAACFWMLSAYTSMSQIARLADQKRTAATHTLEIGMLRTEVEAILSTATAVYECSFNTYYLFNEDIFYSAPIEVRYNRVANEEVVDVFYTPETDMVSISECERTK